MFKKKIIISVLALLPITAFAEDCDIKNNQEVIGQDVQKISMEDFYKLGKEKSDEHNISYGVSSGFIYAADSKETSKYNEVIDKKIHEDILNEYSSSLIVGSHIPTVLHEVVANEESSALKYKSMDLIFSEKLSQINETENGVNLNNGIFNIVYHNDDKSVLWHANNGEEMLLNYDKYLTDIASIKLEEEKDSHISSEHYTHLYHFKNKPKMMDNVLYDSGVDNKVHSDIDNFVSIHMLNALTQKK